jgi:hypothetical protein
MSCNDTFARARKKESKGLDAPNITADSYLISALPWSKSRAGPAYLERPPQPPDTTHSSGLRWESPYTIPSKDIPMSQH